MSDSIEIPITVGRAPLKVPGIEQPCHTWFKMYGAISPFTTPLITLHGGPGMGHNYLLTLKDLTNWRPVIFYDQLGCGNSTHLRDKRDDSKFWTPKLFMDELENLIKHLEIISYDLLGQSWGGMLAGQFACERQPRGLRHLVIADSPSDMRLWAKATGELRADLPKDVQEVLKRNEEKGTTDSPEYEKAVMEFYKRHLCRLETWPQELLDTFENVKKDDTVYWTMNGPSEFHVIGNLKDWDITDQLPKISVPVLLINGAYDEATDEVVNPWFREIGHVKWVQFAKSSHLPNLEERERFMEVVNDFLKWV